MSLRRVLGPRAGPGALGILVPPGRRTVLIVRPRSLAWDLLLVRAEGTSGGKGDGTSPSKAPTPFPPDAPAGGPAGPFREFGQAEAESLAQGLARSLDAWCDGGPGRVEVVPAPGGYCVRADVGEFPLLACLREPGRPYRAVVFAGAEEARRAAGDLAAVLCPPAGAEQELYFNTRNFARP